MSDKKIGVIGLGNMGMPISKNLMKAGFSVVGFDPVPEKLTELAQAGGEAVKTAEEVGAACKYILLSLPTEKILMAVLEQVYNSASSGTIVMEISTMPLAAKQKGRDMLAQKDIILLDTPLSGTGAQAITGDLVVYASGDSAAIADCMDVFDGFARQTCDLGDFGNGTKMKFIANQLVAIHNLSTAEAILFGVNSGLDANQVIEVIGSGAGSSKMLQVRGPLMAQDSFEKATCSNRVFQKDLKLIGDALKESGTPSPLFDTAVTYYTAAMAAGYEDEDTASVYAVLKKMSGK